MIVDVHAHITPPELLERFPMPRALGDVEGMIEQKERAGIGLSIVGSPVGVGTMVPVPGLDNFEQSSDSLRRFHDWLGETVSKHRDRLRGYVWANPFGDADHLEQTASYARDDAFVGLIVNTSIRGEYLDSPRADDFFALASELDLPLLVHPPAEPVGAASLRDFRLVEQVGRVVDVTVGLAALAFGRRLDEHPGLKVIGAMAGGALALLPERLEVASRSPLPGGPGAAGAPEPSADAATALRRLHVDTATFSAENLDANLRVLGVDHVLFGSDSPPASRPLADSVALVERLLPAEADRRRVFNENASALFDLGLTPAAASEPQRISTEEVLE